MSCSRCCACLHVSASSDLSRESVLQSRSPSHRQVSKVPPTDLGTPLSYSFQLAKPSSFFSLAAVVLLAFIFSSEVSLWPSPQTQVVPLLDASLDLKEKEGGGGEMGEEGHG